MGTFKHSKIKCDVTIIYPSRYINQLVTGYLLLQRQGAIDLSIKYLPLSILNTASLKTLINDKITIAYDISDGYNNANQNQYEEDLDKIDFLFKRSYNWEVHKHYHKASRIFPMGFYYDVTTNGNPSDSIKRNTPTLIVRKYIKDIFKLFYVERFEDVPRKVKNPKILFNFRLWNPYSESVKDLPELQQERIEINDMRIKCLKKLKREFGKQFIGGIAPTDFAKRNYSQYVVNDIFVNRLYFMHLIKKSDICIATMGLHRSNGAKIAEYIAASKAIVSENLYYEVPGDFQAENNYLEFDTPDNCVEQTVRLVEDTDLAFSMKLNNYVYYHKYLRADRLVYNTIKVALES